MEYGHGTNMERSDRREAGIPLAAGGLDAAAPLKFRIVYRIEPNTWFPKLDLVGPPNLNSMAENPSVMPLREDGLSHRGMMVSL
jgi:hypothetical protein